MTGEYYLAIRGRDGTKRAEVSDMLNLAYTRKVNAAGILTFDLVPEHAAIALLETDGQVEAWRRDLAAGIPWTCDFATFYRGGAYQVDESGSETFTATCVGQLHLLSRRVVAYPANVVGYSKIRQSPAEAIMRRIVQTNCTSIATVANGRLRDGAIAGLDVETNQNRGNAVAWSGPGNIVLNELQALAPANVGGGDFDLVKTGAQAWVFRFYPGQLGTDRSSGTGAVVFSRDFDNMGEPHLVYDRVDEKTVAIVAGQGEERARAFTVRTGPDFSATNDVEQFVDARNVKEQDALATAGDQALATTRAWPVLTFTPLQTPQTFYGRHYFLGDLVRATYRDVTVVQKVVAATISLARDGGEDIRVELATP